MFFSLDSWELALLIFAVIGAASAVGVVAGRYARRSPDAYREPIGVLQMGVSREDPALRPRLVERMLPICSRSA